MILHIHPKRAFHDQVQEDHISGLARNAGGGEAQQCVPLGRVRCRLSAFAKEASESVKNSLAILA